MKNRSVPTSTVLPHLVYCDLQDASIWLERVFGFSEHFRYGEPVSGIQMSLDDAYIMLTGPRSGTDSPARLGHGTQTLTIIVADVYAHFLTSRREGAVIWEELHVTVYGERQYGVTDLDGHRWLFSEHVQDVDPKDWGAIMKLDDRKL